MYTAISDNTYRTNMAVGNLFSCRIVIRAKTSARYVDKQFQHMFRVTRHLRPHSAVSGCNCETPYDLHFPQNHGIVRISPATDAREFFEKLFCRVPRDFYRRNAAISSLCFIGFFLLPPPPPPPPPSPSCHPSTLATIHE